MVQFLNLSAAYEEIKDEIDDAVSRVLSSGWYILGPEVEKFEEHFAARVAASHAIGVGSGLDALIVALRALGIGEGDDVLVPSNTFIATWLAVSHVGARPIPVEPDPNTFNIDPEKIKLAVTKKSKALISVHLYGQPADIDKINGVAKELGLYTIEDAAQAHGAKYKNRLVGGHSDLVCWSFYPGKNLGALGDGGAITTENAALAAKVRLIRNYGSHEKYKNEVLGMNSRLDPVQAAILDVKLKYLEEWNARRASVAQKYMNSLKNPYVKLPEVPQWALPSWHLFVLQTSKREDLQAHLKRNGVETIIHYPIPPHAQQAYEHLHLDRGSLPIAERLANEVISLPIGPHISEDDIETVIDGVNSFNT